MSNIFERQLVGSGIPLDVGTAFFMKLKHGSAKEEMDAAAQHGSQTGFQAPDETGALEGQFTLPVEQVIALMGEMVENEMKTMYAYKVYANSLRDLSHHTIAEEFESHAEQELEHADFLLRRMAVLGGPVQVPDIPAPPASSDPIDIITTMMRMEQEGVARWQTLHAATGENPTKYTIEGFLTVEQEHLDELWQMLPQEARKSLEATGTAAGTPMPPDGTPPDPVATPQVGTSEAQKMAAVLERFRPGEKIAAAEHTQRGHDRAEGNLASKAKMHEGSRGELYGGLAGRLAGGAGGAVAGKGGGHLAAVAAAALGQHLGGKAGAAFGKELDTRKQKAKEAGVKLSFDDGMNMLAMEQQAEEAQQQNMAQYFQDKARQESQAREQIEAQAQAAQQELEQLKATQEQQNAALQTTLQSANDTATRALTQAVQSTQQSIAHRQQAADVTISMDGLRQNLRELADGGGSAGGPGTAAGQQQQAGGQPPATSGAGAPGEPAAGPSQEGPAGQAQGGQSAPGAAPPEGAQQAGSGSGPAPAQSPESGADGSPAREQSVGEKGPSVNVKVSFDMGALGQTLLGEAKKRAPHALAGAAAGAGVHAGLTRGDAVGRAQADVDTAKGKQEGFADAMALAKAQAMLAFQQAAASHPMSSLGGSAIAGGMLGGSVGPDAVELGKGMYRDAGELGGALKNKLTQMRG